MPPHAINPANAKYIAALINEPQLPLDCLRGELFGLALWATGRDLETESPKDDSGDSAPLKLLISNSDFSARSSSICKSCSWQKEASSSARSAADSKRSEGSRERHLSMIVANGAGTFVVRSEIGVGSLMAIAFNFFSGVSFCALE